MVTCMEKVFRTKHLHSKILTFLTLVSLAKCQMVNNEWQQVSSSVLKSLTHPHNATKLIHHGIKIDPSELSAAKFKNPTLNSITIPKISSNGTFLPFNGVTVISMVRLHPYLNISNKQLKQTLLDDECGLCEYYTLLPVESWHVTICDLLSLTRTPEANKDFNTMKTCITQWNKNNLVNINKDIKNIFYNDDTNCNIDDANSCVPNKQEIVSNHANNDDKITQTEEEKDTQHKQNTQLVHADMRGMVGDSIEMKILEIRYGFSIALIVEFVDSNDKKNVNKFRKIWEMKGKPLKKIMHISIAYAFNWDICKLYQQSEMKEQIQKNALKFVDLLYESNRLRKQNKILIDPPQVKYFDKLDKYYTHYV